MGSKLFVGGLSWNTTDVSLRTAFESFGQIREARVILDRETGKSRGFGFVTFQRDDDAQSAIRSMNGAMLDGRTIRVNEAEERRGGPGGGPGGDRRGPPRRDGDRGGPGPEVHTRGRPPFRGGPGGPGGGGPGGPGGPRGPGGDRGRPGGWSPQPSFRAPPPPGPGEGDWGDDRGKRTERRTLKKKPATATGAWDEDAMRMRLAPKREKRESGRSWRDYAADEDLDEGGDVVPGSEEAEGDAEGAGAGEAAGEGGEAAGEE